ncbi:phosphotransferase enzyme family protein [Micromonospora sp. HK10]|uniref:phosphotransferase enzyme family protein n=1 Tax=Micromonospora sp. HK10 TaxID=1538294 RepID=UPI000626F301|nr:phosphotransferase [Micromonospora sp. HK10]KKJ98519.1 hypothetical protein LQ51_24325 [Micromonospora sp. HK10]
MIDEERVRSCLAAEWYLTGATVTTHNGGMNSATWLVTARGGRWVAKAVRHDSRRSLVGGLTVAAQVERAGVPAGAPVATRHGDVVTELDGFPLALLRWVEGEELSSSTPEDQRVIGRTLGRVHQVLRDSSVEDVEGFHWIDVQAPHLAIRPWIRAAVAAAVQDYDALDPAALSWGLLHTDPAPEAFRLDRGTGSCGLIDWSTATRGPLLYDLASAVMYVGGPRRADWLVEAYLSSRTVGRAEVEHALATLLRFRWAVQADYFARRLATGDLTGIASHAQNEKGLADARRWLDRLG